MPRQIANPNFKEGGQTSFKLPPITGLGFDVWAEFRDMAFTNIIIATDEAAIREWNEYDFVIRQRRQASGMKFIYDWINIDLPKDAPEAGVLNHLEYAARCVNRFLKGLGNRPNVIAIGIVVTVTIMAFITLACLFCGDDHIERIKLD